jgi:hypothetical protein
MRLRVAPQAAPGIVTASASGAYLAKNLGIGGPRGVFMFFDTVLPALA